MGLNTSFTMESLKRLVRNYFGFPKSQTYGLLILIPMIFVILLLPNLYKGLTQIEYDKFESDKALLDSLISEWNENLNTPKVDAGFNADIVLFNFNPNSSSIEELVSLGLEQRLANRLINYRNAGGNFSVKDDLKKIYGFPSSLFESLRPYILLPDKLPESNERRRVQITETDMEESLKETNVNQRRSEKVEALMFTIDINTADSLAFRKLRGIGPVYSSRIVKFRAIVGGFNSVGQIKDVFGISDSLFQSFEHQLLVSPAFKPIQININLASFKEINAHPYISFEQTKEIMNGKSKYGKYRSPADLQMLSLFDSLQIVKLTPYLIFK